MENTIKFNKILTAMLLWFSTIATVTITPWAGIFITPGALWPYIVMPVLLWGGCLGWILRTKMLCGVGVYGSYLYLFMVAGEHIGPEEAYYANSLEPPMPPSTEFLIIRFLCLSFIAVVLLGCFRTGSKRIQNEKAAQPGIDQGKEAP